MPADLRILELAIGHAFRDPDLLVRALTHKSSVYEKAPAEGTLGDNEQFEFLGDSILGFLVSESLVRSFPAYPEGRLSKLKAHLVSAAHLHEVAQAINLGDYLLLGRGEEMSGGREKKALLANAVEAVIAAMYLDTGISTVHTFVEQRVIGSFIPTEDVNGRLVTDYKSALQETAQSLKLPPPRYVIVKETGPEHAKTFTVEVRIGKEMSSQADGCSKKSAGQKAAQLVLERLLSTPAAPATMVDGSGA